MKQFITEFRAVRWSDGEIITYGGENITALTHQMAQAWCDENKPWLKVLGELIAEIPCKEGTYEPDWNDMTDYEQQQLN